MKLLFCFILTIAFIKVQCADLPASQEATKVETQPTENQETDVGENIELSDSLEDYYDESSEYWDSLDDIEGMDDDTIKPTDMPEINSVDVDEVNQFLDDGDDDDDEDEDEDEDDDDAWRMELSSDAQLEDGEDSAEGKEHDDLAEDIKSYGGETWSYSKYLEQQVKERAFRRWMFISVAVGCMLLVTILLVTALRLRKVTTNKATPYDHLHEEA